MTVPGENNLDYGADSRKGFMSALGEVVISTVELFEAEARKLQSGARGLLSSMLLMVVAGVLVLVGLGWLVAAGYLQLRVWMSPAAASALMGLLAILAGGILWYTNRKT